MQGLRSLFCCGSRAHQRTNEPVDVNVSAAPEDALRPHGPPPAPPPAAVGLNDGLDESVAEGMFMREAFSNQRAQEPVSRSETPPPDQDIEDVSPVVPPGGRWRTFVNCSDAGVQAAFRDGISVTLSGGLALLARAAAMMGAAQSRGAAIAVGLGATAGAVGMLTAFWPRAVTLILEPTSLRESAGARRFVMALPFLALGAALAATPDEDDNTKVTIAALALARQLAALMRDTFTQTQAGAWGGIEACTADGDGLTHEQARALQVRRAAVAAVVYTTMCWFILNQGADLLAEGLTPVTDGMKEDVRAGFPSPGWPLNERGETVTQVLARTSFPFNVVDIASRTLLGVVLETFDGYNSGGLAPAVAALSLGLRFRYKRGVGPSALRANWSSCKAAATWQRILNNTSMRMGFGMGTDISTAVGLREPAGTRWRIGAREATAILNGLTEPRSYVIERGVNAGALVERRRRAQADAATDAAAQEAQGEHVVSVIAEEVELAVRSERKSDPAGPRPPSPRTMAQIESTLHKQTHRLVKGGEYPKGRPERPLREAQSPTQRVTYTIGSNDSVAVIGPATSRR